MSQALGMLKPKILAILAFLVAFAAQAQEVVTPASAPGPVSNFFVSLLPHALELITFLMLTITFPAIYKWIAAKQKEAVANGKSTTLLSVGEKVAHLSQLVVANIDAKMRPEIARRAADGELDANDKAVLRAMALEDLKLLLTPAGITEVAKALGTPSAPVAPLAVDMYLSAQNEVAVDTKNAITVVAAAA